MMCRAGRVTKVWRPGRSQQPTMNRTQKKMPGRSDRASGTAAKTKRHLAAENKELRACLVEAQETLQAIRSGVVDAPIVSTGEGERAFLLQGADRSYRALIEEINEGVLGLTPAGVILYANHKFAALLKTPLDKVIGSTIRSWTTPDSRKVLEPLLQDGVHQRCQHELSLAAQDGSTVPVYLSVSPMSMDGNTDVLGVVATDLTERKQAEQALRLSEAKFRNVFENAALGKALVSMDGKIEFNSAVLDFLGYSEQELRAKTWQDVAHPDDAPAIQNALKGLLGGQLAGARFENRFIHKDGSMVWADMNLGLIGDGTGKPLYVLISINDITARKEADAALHELRQHLQRNIEMERLRLAQELHDAPLQELYGVLYRLEELRAKASGQNAAAIREVIAEIKSTLSHLRAIASELRPPAISQFGFERAAHAYVKDFREKYPGIRVRTSFSRDGQSLPEAVRMVLFRVLQETLANVARHADANEIKVRFRFDDQEASLEISDNGKGFSVPDNWVELARAGHYGLAGMAERIRSAGGLLQIVSSPGGSTRVRAAVPRSAG